MHRYWGYTNLVCNYCFLAKPESVNMVGTPPYQKKGSCGHWMPAFDSHLRCYSCSKNVKGEYPCASGAPVEACASCASLTKVEWNHLRSVYAERSVKHANKSVPADTPAPDSEEELEAGEIDDSILDLNQMNNLLGPDTPLPPASQHRPASLHCSRIHLLLIRLSHCLLSVYPGQWLS